MTGEIIVIQPPPDHMVYVTCLSVCFFSFQVVTYVLLQNEFGFVRHFNFCQIKRWSVDFKLRVYSCKLKLTPPFAGSRDRGSDAGSVRSRSSRRRGARRSAA